MSLLGSPKVLLVDAFDDALQSHAALRHRALERLGCRVVRFDLTESPGIMDRLRGTDLTRRLGRTVRDEAPNIVLVVDGQPLSAAAVTELRRIAKSAVWALWLTGDVRSMASLAHAASAYHTVVCAGSEVVAALETAKVPGVAWLPLACDPSVHRPMRSRDQFRANVVFVGSATPRREKFLMDLVEFGLAVWGPGWRRSALRDYCRGDLVSLDDYVRAYAGASIGINIHRYADSEPALKERHCNRRVFELAAIGVPQVVDFRADLHRVFEDEQEILVFRSAAQLRALVREALMDLTALEDLAGAARRRALAEHTYMHRLQVLLEMADGRR